MLEQLISTIFTYLNAGGYYKSALEIQNAINTAQLQLYKKLRGNLADYAPGRPKSIVNFQETIVTSDSLTELYFTNASQGVGTVAYRNNIDLDDPNLPLFDLLLSLEVNYSSNGQYYPVNIVPDNQYLMMINNTVIYPKNLTESKRPIGRMNGDLKWDVYPLFHSANIRYLKLPKNVQFSLTDNPNSSVPDVVPGYVDTEFSKDKFNNLLFLTLENLGININNALIVQSSAQKEYREL
jgi:hypothetical protein